MVPGEASRSVSVVGDHKGLLHEHVHAVITELELHLFGGELQTYRIGLGLYKEVEGPVIDVVSDRNVEGLDHLRAKHNIKASFLSRWDNLAKRCAAAELRELIDHESHIDVLS